MQQYKPCTYHLCKTMVRIVAEEGKKRETKFDVFVKVSEPSFQLVWLYNIVLNNI